jgi:ring-1,2-phenylacetyl-CoA epoxidase subunit PaaC
MVLVWDQLQASQDSHLAAIAAKSLKEVRYHLRHSRDWLLRMGDGTAESHARAQAAVNHLMPYTQEFWTHSAYETEAARITGLDMIESEESVVLVAHVVHSEVHRRAVGCRGEHHVDHHARDVDFVLAGQWLPHILLPLVVVVAGNSL